MIDNNTAGGGRGRRTVCGRRGSGGCQKKDGPSISRSCRIIIWGLDVLRSPDHRYGALHLHCAHHGGPAVLHGLQRHGPRQRLGVPRQDVHRRHDRLRPAWKRTYSATSSSPMRKRVHTKSVRTHCAGTSSSLPTCRQVSQDSALNNLGTLSSMGMTLFNTVFYLIGIPIGMILSMFFAVCMSRDIKGANFFRVVYYLPSVASTVAGRRYLQQAVPGRRRPSTRCSEQGSLGSRTSDGQPLVGVKEGVDPFWQQGLLNKTMIVVMMVWKGLGGTIILYIAGLSGVNAATKEAAQIDGRERLAGSSGRSPCPICTPLSSIHVCHGDHRRYADLRGARAVLPDGRRQRATNATYLGKPQYA